jgi:hypothetical protein
VLEADSRLMEANVQRIAEARGNATVPCVLPLATGDGVSAPGA